MSSKPSLWESNPEFAAAEARARSLGYVPGVDFVVWGVPGFIGSAVIELGADDDDYVVLYTDMGRRRVLFRSPDISIAIETFFSELASMAGARGRGPRAGLPEVNRYEGMSYDEVRESLRYEASIQGSFKQPRPS